jgi:hypothetical protein
MSLSPELRAGVALSTRRNHRSHIYRELAKTIKSPKPADIEKIAADELEHANQWKVYTQQEVSPVV